MNATEQAPLPDGCVQRLVLNGAHADHALHLILRFTDDAQPRLFLQWLFERFPLSLAVRRDGALTAAPAVDVAFGLSYRGLQALHLPPYVLREFVIRAPAFTAGAPLRAVRHLGDCGPSAPRNWDPGFVLDAAHAVLSLHAKADAAGNNPLDGVAQCVRVKGRAYGVKVARGLVGARLPSAAGLPGQAVHFGYRDGLSRVLVRGWHRTDGARPVSVHAPGEFLLGHLNDHRFNPWALPSALHKVRRFFHNGSFGVLRRMEQDVQAFEEWVCNQAQSAPSSAPGLPASLPERINYLKAKLCGRGVDGRRIGPPGGPDPGAALDDFDYEHDPAGLGCPFGAHIRRMSPRRRVTVNGESGRDDVIHRRQRPLIRRGMPYGPVFAEANADAERGLLGLFFCASIEDQFEHLLGEWAERPPMGTPDRGDAKDPLIGQHDDPKARFEIPLPGQPSAFLSGFGPFVRTRGTLYAFYPSSPALKSLIDGSDFLDEDDFFEEPLPKEGT